MKHVQLVPALVLAAVVGSAGVARAGAPTPDDREGDFTLACKGGPNKTQACTVATEATDCPKSSCEVVTVSKKTIKGTLTIISDDLVSDWATGFTSPQALTIMLEVNANGSKQILADTYQNMGDPLDLTNVTQAPTAPTNVVAIPMDESAVKGLAAALDGLMFAQPENAIATQLRTLFNTTGTPVIVGVKKKSQFSDHSTNDPANPTSVLLASVLRFKVKIQFVQ